MPETLTAAEAAVLAREWTVFCETVCPAVAEDCAMPNTDCEAEVFMFALVVERSRTVLPVMVLTPEVVTMPRICPAVAVLA